MIRLSAQSTYLLLLPQGNAFIQDKVLIQNLALITQKL